MSERKLYTSKDILVDGEDNESIMLQLQDEVCCTCIGIRYQLSEDELDWLDVIDGKYSIADYIRKNMDDENILTIEDSYGLTKALEDDCSGAGKAVMLSDETALQAIFFYCWDEETALEYNNSEEE